MGAEEAPLKGSGGAGSFVCDVKELRRRARSPVEEGDVTEAAIGPYRGSKFNGHHQREFGALSQERR
jgi:hypothetical protein